MPTHAQPIKIEIIDKELRERFIKFSNQMFPNLREAMAQSMREVGLRAVHDFMIRHPFSHKTRRYDFSRRGGRKLGIMTTRLSRSLTENVSFAQGASGSRESIRRVKISRDQIVGQFGSRVPYACVLWARNKIRVKEGFKTIGQIKIGDQVLTQDGTYQKVIRTNRFPVTYKNDLITLVIPWRRDRNHQITLTTDHKVLINRAGLNKWVEAGDILLMDKLFSPKKINHKKGKYEKKICEYCEKEFRNPGGNQGLKRKYCSKKCKMAAWSISHPHIGMKRTIEAKKKMSVAFKKRIIDNPESHPNRILADIKETKPERIIKEWLKNKGIKYKKQYPINGFFVDFFIKDHNLIIEADGEYWHQNQKRDISRDKKIKNYYPDFKILHLHFTKNNNILIDHNPLKDVYYIKCNSSMDSFCELEKFNMVEILEIKRWKWKKSNKSKASQIPCLYDLKVENNHSFVCNGFLISNSIHEFGGMAGRGRSVHIPARPYLRPALTKSRNRINDFFRKAIEKSIR